MERDLVMRFNHQNPISAFLRNVIALNPTEFAACLMVVFYVIAFLLGMREKQRKRQFLHHVIMPALAKQFYSVTETNGDGLNELACYATGRRGCRSAMANIRLCNSHDFFSFFLLDRLTGNENRILIGIDFLPEDSISPLVYCVVHNLVSKSFLASSPDVRAFARQMPLGYLPKSLVCITENRECLLLTPRMVQALRGAEQFFRYLHISDQIDLLDLDPPDRGIRLCARLPQTEEESQALQELILATCELVDVVVSDEAIFPNREARESAISARMRVRVALSRDLFPAISATHSIMEQAKKMD